MKYTGESPEDIRLSVVIPAFNEAGNIRVVVEEALHTLQQQLPETDVELIVVNDGSTDQTGEICKDLEQQYSPVRAFHHPHNQGIGAAQRTGFANAKGVFVSTIPGDGQIAVDQVVKLYREIGDADLIVSSRESNNPHYEKHVKAVYRGILTSALHQIILLVFKFDSTGKHGIFLIRNTVLQQQRLISSTGLLTLEIIMNCYHRGCIVKQSTIAVKPRLSGHSKVTNISTYLTYFWEIFTLRLKQLRGVSEDH